MTPTQRRSVRVSQTLCMALGNVLFTVVLMQLLAGMYANAYDKIAGTADTMRQVERLRKVALYGVTSGELKKMLKPVFGERATSCWVILLLVAAWLVLAVCGCFLSSGVVVGCACMLMEGRQLPDWKKQESYQLWVRDIKYKPLVAEKGGLKSARLINHRLDRIQKNIHALEGLQRDGRGQKSVRGLEEE